MAVAHPIGWALSDGHEAYIPIPKCASTTMKHAFRDWRPTVKWANQPCPLPSFAVIRNPVDRWFSGVAEYAKRTKQDYDSLLDEVEAGRHPVFDEHTMRQTDFLLSTFTPRLIRIDDVSEFLEERFGRDTDNRHPGEWTPRPSLTPLIETFYAEDVRLWSAGRF